MQVAYEAVIDRGENPNDLRLTMDRYRRTHVDREAASWRQDEELASLVEAYEAELRRNRLIDFDDMPLLALRALARHEWLRRAILAKYSVLVVDEYQDLGTALHRMVMGLCFRTGIRLFGVGDTDQSIYGFTGANPALLERLSQRADVETVHLRLNYRSGARIVAASEYALGEDRGYNVPDDAGEGVVYFHPRSHDVFRRQPFAVRHGGAGPAERVKCTSALPATAHLHPLRKSSSAVCSPQRVETQLLRRARDRCRHKCLILLVLRRGSPHWTISATGSSVRQPEIGAFRPNFENRHYRPSARWSVTPCSG
jgi:hypothetical protein